MYYIADFTEEKKLERPNEEKAFLRPSTSGLLAGTVIGSNVGGLAGGLPGSIVGIGAGSVMGYMLGKKFKESKKADYLL